MSDPREDLGDRSWDWPHHHALVHGDDDPLSAHLLACFPRATSVDVVVAFVLDGGVKMLREFFHELLERGGQLRLLTGDYFDVTEPNGLQVLLDLRGDAVLRVFESQAQTQTQAQPGRQAFHPKAYIFHYEDGRGVAFVGSSNLSRSALGNGVEWNYRIVRSSDQAGFTEVTAQFEQLLAHPRTVPLTHEWIAAYRRRRRPEFTRTTAGAAAAAAAGAGDEQLPSPEPHGIQAEALAALRRTRAAGNRAGLVVLATGLGKTWLSAFDTLALAAESGHDLDAQRVLFVAHREEILDQALHTFRRIRPDASMGQYNGKEKTPSASVLFASVATLHKREHRERFPADHFDYVIIDEFHHADARTYRELIDYFDPKFLLGLTATPERTDGGDLLALCGQNLVFRRDLGDGVRSGLLCPFQYYGVPDDVDYSAVPWRRGRFVDDHGELTRALATEQRAGNALEQWRRRGGTRGLGFCCSTDHADYMARFFQDRGVRAVAVHSNPSSAARANSLTDLEEGKLQVVFCVDMFNEGVDLPHIDTVLMLRPTESRIIWLQQFGRGLRKLEGKVLRVVDYIGNHKVFLTKLQALLPTMLGVGDGHADLRSAIMLLRSGDAGLPDGCGISYELEVIDILEKLLRPTTGEEQLRESYAEFRLQHDRRPTARELFLSGSMRRTVLKRSFGSWFALVERMGDLELGQRGVLKNAAAFLTEIEQSRMANSFRMLVLEAMLEEGRLPGEIDVPRLARRFQRVAERSPLLRRELAATMASSGKSLAGMLRTDALRAWAGTERGAGSEFFELDGEHFRTKPVFRGEVAEAGAEGVLAEMVRELVEWRLAEYQEHRDPVRMEPLGPAAAGGLLVGRSYMREQIPPYFGLTFNASAWRQGIVSVPDGLALLVTLDKSGKVEEHRYKDEFLSPSEFQWQSQNQTRRGGKHGKMIRGQDDPGREIHLFVRKRGKRADSKAAPFFYCGLLDFERWEGEKPITVWWRLQMPVSDELWKLVGSV